MEPRTDPKKIQMPRHPRVSQSPGNGLACTGDQLQPAATPAVVKPRRASAT